MPHTVLVIDDQWSMQELARVVLQGAGYRVLVAGDGATGLSLARTEHPDAIVLDMRMPGMSGLDVLRGLRQDPRTSGLPVMLITPADTPLAAEVSAGVEGCLQKPFHPPQLLHALNRLLQRRTTAVAV